MKPNRCERYSRIDIRELYRQGKVAETQSSIHLSSPTGVHEIALVRSVCAYGGLRPWFKCPCGQRVGVLYASPTGIGCRNCMKLSNASRWEFITSRRRRKLAKLRARLDDGSKPKWMRWPTYERILAQIEETELRLARELESRRKGGKRDQTCIEHA